MEARPCHCAAAGAQLTSERRHSDVTACFASPGGCWESLAAPSSLSASREGPLPAASSNRFRNRRDFGPVSAWSSWRCSCCFLSHPAKQNRWGKKKKKKVGEKFATKTTKEVQITHFLSGKTNCLFFFYLFLTRTVFTLDTSTLPLVTVSCESTFL